MEWPCCKQILLGKRDTANGPLEDIQKIFLLSLYIKLWPMKNSAKAMNRNENFRYLGQKLSWISDTKVKERIFVDPQIKAVRNDRNCDEALDGTKETEC
jgi:hypothetical protein